MCTSTFVYCILNACYSEIDEKITKFGRDGKVEIPKVQADSNEEIEDIYNFIKLVTFLQVSVSHLISVDHTNTGSPNTKWAF